MVLQGTVFLCDYTGTDPDYRAPKHIIGTHRIEGFRMLPKPLAYFWWNSQKNQLVPLAIQVDASADPDTYTPTNRRVFTPSEKHANDWMFAKLCAQIADAHHHELHSHLCRTHFVMEPIAVAQGRTLDVYHPLSVMLRVVMHVRPSHCVMPLPMS